jgi:hypothetical protein
MFILFCRAYGLLIRIDVCLARGDFSGLYERIRSARFRPNLAEAYVAEEVLKAIDLASVWYWKQVPCLQRSAAATLLLRQFGVPAELVIGVQPVPFRAHAWVELEGRVINDKPYTGKLYLVLDRC